MPIRLLPPHVAGRIAAGEVIERPASVVKELVENSLDAGATRVSVEIAEGGVRLIRVTDNGAGIASGELAIAFMRHATSKLPESDDLGAIATLGFRGEALPSIAAVSEVEAVPRQAGAEAGTAVRLEMGEVVQSVMAAAAHGTSISVRNLFRRQPARLKFLRSASSETGQIATVVSHYALA
jgi:DNA mismatch repair protein MutL